jgi:AraC-like DNA-binding protein
MSEQTILTINENTISKNAYSGFFISRGFGIHPERMFDWYALFFVTSGSIGMFEDDREFEVKEGESLLLFPGRKHGGTMTYPSDLNLYWINFQLETDPMIDTHHVLHVPQYRIILNKTRLIELFRLFLDHQESNVANPYQADLLTRLILSEIGNENSSMEKTNWSGLVSRANAYITSHCHETISTSAIAQTLQCNPDYLSRLYRKTTGITITEEINRKRIQLAKKTLLDSTMNINEIAYHCGFDNTSYFHRVFRRLAGLSPNEYRQNFTRMFVNTR